MKFTILTLFPQLIAPWQKEAILGRAVEKGLIDIDIRNLRAYSNNKHSSVDDYPYGGGAGMVIQVNVVAAAIAKIKEEIIPPNEIISLSPAGETFNQKIAQELASKSHICLLCGRYEGFDARVESLVTREISIGDYVLMGGEAAALVLIESAARLIPNVIGNSASHKQDSHTTGLLDYPEYTRPAVFEGIEVPKVLLSGNHGEVARWRREQAVKRTFERRKDLLEFVDLTNEDRSLLAKLQGDESLTQDKLAK